MRSTSSIRLISAATALGLVVAGCTGEDASRPSAERRLSPIQVAASLRQFDSCEQVRTWVRDELAPRVGAYGFAGAGSGVVGALGMKELDRAGGPVTTAAPARDSAAQSATSAPAPGAASSGAFSRTNVQVAGVDEPDVVKTDGTRIVAIVDGKLRLVSASSGKVLATVALPDGMYDGQLLLAGDRVLAFGTDSVHTMAASGVAMPSPGPQLFGTRVLQVDIVDDALRVSDTFVLDGTYVSARLTGSVARVVLHSDPEQALPFVTPAVPGDEAMQRAQQANRAVVEQAAPDAFLPKWRALDADGTVSGEGTLLHCENAHAPNTFSGFGMVAVVSIDLRTGLRDGITSSRATGVMAGGQTVYASPDHLYVAAPEWVDWTALSSKEQRAAAASHGTDIHRFDITDPTRARYEMSGRVAGDLVDQFAMDEHDGNLRVASTTGTPGAEGEGTSVSQIEVLAPKNGALEPIGSVSGLGSGETIHSVRFVGDTGYVVTFRQTDPLYTVDLSDPAAPRVAGELKLLGYSAYLHPAADGYLIGVGQDATEQGRQLGTQVALFDVRDPASAKRVAQATLPNSSSGAEWDHHAFLWWPKDGLAAIPVSAYEQTPFVGLAGYTIDIDAGTITERGRVTHPPVPVDGGRGGTPVPPAVPIDGAGPVASDAVAPALPQFEAASTILRAFVIDDHMWTMSSAGFVVSDLATLAQQQFIAFA
jgi:Beta propeller domain